MTDLHPTLIRANIALFTGDYGEVRRLLADYRAEGGGAAEHAPMALWLDAHAEPNPDERLRRLDALLTLVAPDNPYAQMAQRIIDLERAPEDEPRGGLGLRGAIIFAGIILAALAGIYALSTRTPPPIVADVVTTATISPTAAPLPDRSRPLTSDLYTARYAHGILQVTAVEDGAQRIIDTTGAQVTPVPGARFYAVELAFECRAAICQQPPEAEVALKLADDSLIAPRANVFVQNEGVLGPVALGVTTRGWAVFEIPSIVAVSALQVTSDDADGLPQTLTIPLD